MVLNLRRNKDIELKLGKGKKHDSKKPKCVVVFSGGPDSATVAYWAKKQGYQLYPITFKYGQIAVKETESAQKIAETRRLNKNN